MRLASKEGVGFWEMQAFRLALLRKRLYQRLRYRPSTRKRVLFIVGCQRSGTSMLHHIFQLDRDAVAYGEFGPLSSLDPLGLRFDPLPEVRARIMRDRAPLVVTKPLVESQNTDSLLRAFPEGSALWLFRHYRDVARSNVRHFGQGNSHDDLKPIVAFDQSNWRAEHLDPAVVEQIRAVYTPELSPYDAAALFWYARNSLYFSLRLDQREDVRLCLYDDLVSAPGPMMAEIYAFARRPYPGDRIVTDVFSASKGAGRNIELVEPVRRMCDDLMARLEAEPRLAVGTSASGR